MPRPLPTQPKIPLHENSQLVHGLFYNDAKNTGNIHQPVYFGTTFLRNDQYVKPDERGYIRDDNPTHDQVAALINQLEGGFETLIYPSGAAAMNAVFHALSAGDTAVVQDSLYFGLFKLLDSHITRHGIKIVYFKAGNVMAMQEAVEKHRPKLLWVETPSNPMIHLTDIQQAAAMVHAVGGKLVVDSTCASPIITKPIKWGADIVMHSATKYLNGHTDVLAGALITAREDDLWVRMREARFLAGWVLGTMDLFLLNRGLKTLALRMQAHCQNAMALANHLQAHHNVVGILYPGLPTHPGHAIAQKQMMNGFGGLMSVLVKGGAVETLNVIKKFQMIRRATSLGGIESKAEHRFTIEGEYTTSPPNLVRFSTGIETIDDIIADWEQALN